MRISFDSVTYRSHNELTDAPQRSEPVGTGDALDCEREPFDQVEVRAVAGVDTRVAIVAAISTTDPAALYVAEDLDPDEWPDVIRRTEK